MSSNAAARLPHRRRRRAWGWGGGSNRGAEHAGTWARSDGGGSARGRRGACTQAGGSSVFLVGCWGEGVEGRAWGGARPPTLVVVDIKKVIDEILRDREPGGVATPNVGEAHLRLVCGTAPPHRVGRVLVATRRVAQYRADHMSAVVLQRRTGRLIGVGPIVDHLPMVGPESLPLLAVTLGFLKEAAAHVEARITHLRARGPRRRGGPRGARGRGARGRGARGRGARGRGRRGVRPGPCFRGRGRGGAQPTRALPPHAPACPISRVPARRSHSQVHRVRAPACGPR